MHLRALLPLVVGAGALLLGAPLGALYFTPEITLVPVHRLVANLEREVAAFPKIPSVHINLARLHGMAFALKRAEFPTTQAAVLRGVDPPSLEDNARPWYGHEPNLVPYEVKPAASEESAKEADAHLRKALEHYRIALQLAPDSLPARLGYAWMLDKSGNKGEAIVEYRRVIAEAWPKEREQRTRDVGERFYTEETTGYLIPLLDPQQDAAEIATLEERRAALNRYPRAITPVAVPLHDGLPLDTIQDGIAQVSFDADGSGLRRHWTWISRNAGWLVYDAEGTGEITSALQWFGSVTFWLFWPNGYEALAALDDDGDEELRGTELELLAIWHDRNSNGRSERGEVQPLARYRIAAVSCRYLDGDGVQFAAISPQGVRFVDGKTRPTYDVILRQLDARRFSRSRLPQGSHGF